MPTTKANLLIVDDDSALRSCLSAVFGTFGHGVRTAADGFSALEELRQEIPDIIVSDLNMPGMSGFEFLSVVRRRFPTIQVIAMSSALVADGVPLGVAADAFYQKGTGLRPLLQIVAVMTSPEQPPFHEHAGMPAPIWVERNEQSACGGAFIVLTCPECLRPFSRVTLETQSPIHGTSCIYCNSLFHYAIVQAAGPAPRKAQRRKHIHREIPLEQHLEKRAH